jgi:capsular polysaccharide biosynthesis protein
VEQPIFTENETELIDYLNVIWKRKWLIVLPTFFLVIAVGIISFLLPKQWEIDALIQPSKFLVQTEGGQFNEVVVTDPKQIASQINQKTYDRLIVAELNLDARKFPKLKAENLRDTNLVRVSTKENDIEKAKLILRSLFRHLKRQLDGKVDIEAKGIDSEIKSKEIEELRIEEEIKTYKNKLDITKQRKKEIEKELSGIRKRIEALEKEQSLSLKKENRSESESLAMLLYSNEIQQSLEYHNTLNELLSEKKIEEENINLDYTQLIKEPTSSIYPVSPKKKLNVLVAGVIGLMIFTMLSFFLEYLKKQRIKIK